SGVANGSATVPASGLPGMHAGDALAAASRSLLSPQASGVRRTGSLPPIEKPPKKNVVGTVSAALFLLGVIVYGANKLRPVYDDRQHRSVAATNAPTTTDPSQTQNGSTEGSTLSNAPETSSKDSPPSVPEKGDTELTAKAAEYKNRIDATLAKRGWAGRAHVEGQANTLTLIGKLRPAEHRALLSLLRDAPAEVQMVDHIEYEDISRGKPTGFGIRPVPSPGYGAIRLVANVVGASAVLRGGAGVVGQCQTPCTFNDLNPAQYSLEVRHCR